MIRPVQRGIITSKAFLGCLALIGLVCLRVMNASETSADLGIGEG